MVDQDVNRNFESSDQEVAENEIPDQLPILPVRGTVIFPSMVLPLMVGRPKSVKLIDDALIRDKMIGLVSQITPEKEEPDEKDLYRVGTSAVILRMVKIPDDNTIRILVQAQGRFRINRFVQKDPYFIAALESVPEQLAQSREFDALVRTVRNLFSKVVEQSPQIPSDVGTVILNISEPTRLADMIASSLNLKVDEKQELLEIADVKKRMARLSFHLNKELEILELGNKIQNEIKTEMDKNQREYILRQQLKALQKELGEGDEKTVEVEEFRERIRKAEMPDEVRKIAEKELERLAVIPAMAAEFTVVRTYLDWLVEIPWSKSTTDNLDIRAAMRILDEDHFDLDRVKDRILEYLAVRKMKPGMKGPILCFVGPPGVGKTSLGRSIARALGRKFVRMSLGGVRDEAEIRGHRRTYVGALPGRIIQNIRRAGSNNPVYMLDEVDKIGMDFRGDPASALLEVLDPEQNFSFADHYLDVDFDLSRVMFITTANILETIPPPLRDRMEVLRLPGYTMEDKINISRRFLIPKQLEAHGLDQTRIRFHENSLRRIVEEYTREAGLRNLEREIANICRKVARRVAEGRETMTVVTSKSVPTYLGPQRFFSEIVDRASEPGVSIGLAWTPVGGQILFIEASRMVGKKGLTLTGSLGDVMKESAQAALTFIRANASQLGVEKDFFETSDIHIHVPEGASPKDGPSAGVAIFTALLSLLKGKRVRGFLAMTGEITLRGQVLPVGGIKEKVLAAHRAGIRMVILPMRNQQDVEEIPKPVREDLSFHFVSKMSEIPGLALPEQEDS